MRLYITRNCKLFKRKAIYLVYRKESNDTTPFEIEDDTDLINIPFIRESKENLEAVQIPIQTLESIFIIASVSITSGVINELARENIPMHFFSVKGNYLSSLIPFQANTSGKLHVLQAAHYLDNEKRMYLAKSFILGSAKNMLRNIYRHKELEQGSIQRISYLIKELKNSKSIFEAMALEGNIRDEYYSWLDRVLEPEFKMNKRVRAPPNNEVNAMISFGNSLLYAIVLNNIFKTQLDQSISFLHEPSERRFSLSLDISEIFKPIIVDRAIIKLIKYKMIDESHFDKTLEGCVLNNNGIRIFVSEFERRLSKTIYSRRLNRRITYNRLIYLECLKLVKHLIGIKEYKPLIAEW